MAVNVYEGLFLLDPNRYARDPNGTSAEVDRTIQKFGGQLLVSRLWDERRLAYPVDGQKKGTYWLTYFKMDSAKLTPMNREFRINEAILRQMIIRIDPRLSDVLVEHAKSGGMPSDLRAAEAAASDAATPEAATAGGTGTAVAELEADVNGEPEGADK